MPLCPKSLLGRSRQRHIQFIAKRHSKALRGHLSNASSGGSPTKVYGSIMEVFANVVAPLTLTMAPALASNGHGELQHLIHRYILFKVVLGTWRPHHVDDVWCPSRMCYHRELSQLLTRREYYLLHKCANPCITDVLYAIYGAWSELWRWGCAAAGDEAIVPHKGKKAGPLRQFIPRNPHSTGKKLYVLGDAWYPFVPNVYLYASKKTGVHAGGQRVAGPLTPTEVVHHWVDHLPLKTTTMADSCFGGHRMAHQFALCDHPFPVLCKRNKEGVAEAGGSLKPGQVGEAVCRGRGYNLKLFKNPKVGSKPPRVVPILTNCSYPSQFTKHKNRYELPHVVASYRVLANGVDSANQMALEHRGTGCFQSWRRAVLAFIIRYCIVNTFTICRRSGLVPGKTSLWDFQWNLAEHLVPDHFETPAKDVHIPIRMATRGVCSVCHGRTYFYCGQCGIPMYKRCFDTKHCQQ